MQLEDYEDNLTGMEQQLAYDAVGNAIGKPKKMSVEDEERAPWQCSHCGPIMQSLQLVPYIHNVDIQFGHAPHITSGAPAGKNRMISYTGEAPNAMIGPLCQTCYELFSGLMGLDNSFDDTLNVVQGRKVRNFFRTAHDAHVNARHKAIKGQK